MELRIRKESREIELRNTEIRQTKRGHPISQSKNLLGQRTAAIQAIANLPAKQKKIWNTYCPAKQEKILRQVEHRVGRRLEYSALDTVQPSRKFVVLLKDPSNQTEAEIGQQTVQVMAPVIPDMRMPDKRENDHNAPQIGLRSQWQREYSEPKGQGGSGLAEKKRKQQASRKRTGLYRRELGQVLSQETRRFMTVKQKQRELQIEQTLEQKEQETKHLAGMVFAVPGKVMLAPVRTIIVSAISKAAGSLTKYGLLAGLPLLLLFLLFQTIVSSVSGLMAEEQSFYGAAGQEVVAYAEHWIGVTRYVLGAGRADATDWQDYTDCSGFVHGVFAHFGYEIGSYTATQQDAGELVEINSLDSAMPGDIILFYKNGEVSHENHEHVAIYAGNGNMIHCSGGAANYSIETAGPGVVWGTVLGDGRPWMVRRIVDENFVSSSGQATGGYRKDSTPYTQDQIELIWAIVAQEDNGSYEGALAVISSAMNRTESLNWTYCGSNALEQLTAPGQYCYSNDDYWRPRLGGNVPNYVKQAVSDCLDRGIRNHEYTSFRSQKGSVTGPNAVQIGGNWFFGN